MTNAEKMGLLMALYNGIFQSKAQNTDITALGVPSPHVAGGIIMGRWFVNGTLRGFDFDVQDGTKTLQLRILEQNPDKTDAAGNRTYYANLAHQGHCIAWVIDRKPGGSFLGRIQAGQWHVSQQRATIPATPQNVQTAAALVPSVEGIPDIPNDIGISDYVLIAVSEDEEGEYGLDQYE
ncbi:hypothetical protein LCGC14_1223770 [marine sediment metagenome]|uniref:Uncharacterized protein n=1 Tax=marine sediment metagenome TaxID=412755 RepID=A0A0F9LXQ0_9ZZZZ